MENYGKIWENNARAATPKLGSIEHVKDMKTTELPHQNESMEQWGLSIL